MDKFERVEGFCRTRELAVKSESIEDTLKDIAIYATLAMILYRRDSGGWELEGLSDYEIAMQDRDNREGL